MVVSDVYLEENCFNAQQCAEKAIKAVFIDRGETFPFIHNLKKLLTLLEENGIRVPKYVSAADELSPYAAVTRYPEGISPVTPQKYRRAVRIATAVLRWAARQVEPPRSKGKK
jgi:HEPN domain-containing protein